VRARVRRSAQLSTLRNATMHSAATLSTAIGKLTSICRKDMLVRRGRENNTHVPTRQSAWLRGVMCALVLLAMLCAGSGHAAAAEPVDVRVTARIALRRGEIDGAMEVRVRVAEGEDHVALWLYADRLAVVPASLDEQTYRVVYPGEAALGAASLADVRVDGRPVTPRRRPDDSAAGRSQDVSGALLDVPVVPGPARILPIRLRFRVRVPARFGRLGRVDDVLALAGPWYPIVVDGDAWDFRVPQRLSLTLVDGGALVAGESPVGRDRLEHQAIGPYVPVVAAPALRAVLRRPSPVAGDDATRAPSLRVVMRARDGDSLTDLVEVERHVIDEAGVDRVALALAGATETLRRAGLAGSPAQVTALVVPSRTELVGVAPGVLLLSDRFGEVAPIDATERFHDRAATRGWLRARMASVSTALEPPRDRPFADDLRAALLAELDEARRHGGATTMQELLGFAAFHPLVDQLLYAPQVPFPEVFFAGHADRERLREDPMRAFAPVAGGLRLLEAARAAHGADFAAVAETLLDGRTPVRAVLARGAVEPARIDAWLVSPARPRNYRLGAVRTTREGADFVHRIEVLRVVPEGAPQPVEPVEVEVTTVSDETVHGHWDGRGTRGEVTLRTRGALGEVLLDPRQRLAQSPSLADGHPRADDATSHPYRPPILQALTVTYSAAEQRLDGVLDVALRRRFDLDTSWAFRLDSGPASTGGAVRYLRGVGPKRDDNNRIGALSFGLELERLRADFGEGTNPGVSSAGRTGWAGALLVAGGFDTRTYRLDPRHGGALAAALRLGGVLRDDGSLSASVAMAVRGAIMIPMGTRNALLLAGGTGATLGRPLPGELQSLGGLGALRGLRSDALLGRGRVYAVAEHRATLLADLGWSLAGVVFVRELQLGVFAGAGLVFDEWRADGAPGRAVAAAADAGGGLRLHFHYGGVQPGVLVLDLAVPLVGGQGLGPAPYIAFDQYF
jgi:hypothetical protein